MVCFGDKIYTCLQNSQFYWQLWKKKKAQINCSISFFFTNYSKNISTVDEYRLAGLK